MDIIIKFDKKDQGEILLLSVLIGENMYKEI